MNSINSEKDMLLRTIDAKDGSYNPQIRMLRSAFSSPGYHTAIKKADYIHSTRNSLNYALGLLDTERETDGRRAFDIIGQVVSLQDKNRSSATFGIWPWFYEEPLDRMSPPDWNWADFCGKCLVLAILRHGRRFPEPLREEVREAIFHACDAIILRNVGPDYTNIAIMGAFVTMIAGELFGREDYRIYGLNRLEKLVRFTRERQAFQEYNSPTYTYVAILELSKIASATTSPEARALSAELLDVAWQSVSEHYHVSTRQWSGPHARSYGTLLGDQIKAFLQLSTNGALTFFPWEELPYDEEWYGSGTECPDRYLPGFAVSDTREIRRCYQEEKGAEPAKWATTYMTPSYSLGSFNKEILWNQRRALLAYVDNAGEPVYAHFRCLHDGYDYSSAVLHAEQEAGFALFGVSFLANGGDTHPNLDKLKDGAIEASDFRLRLELGGFLERVTVEGENGEAAFRINGIPLRLRTHYAAFGEHASPEGARSWQTGENGGKLAADLVIHSGEPARIDFRSLNAAAFLFTLRIGEDGGEPPFIHDIESADGRLTARTVFNGRVLSITLPIRPVE